MRPDLPFLILLLTLCAALVPAPPVARAQVVRHSHPCGSYRGERAYCVDDVRPGQAAGLSCHLVGWRVSGYSAAVLARDGEDYVDVLDEAPPGRYGPLTIRRWPNGSATARVARGTWELSVWCRRK